MLADRDQSPSAVRPSGTTATGGLDGWLVASFPVTLRLSHRTARVVGATGRTLIGLGIITLLFVAYQLWGTGLQHAQSQERLADEFAAQLEATEQGRSTTTTTLPEELPQRGIGASGPLDFPGVTTTTTEPPTLDDLDPETLAALVPRPGEPIAQIRIPSIGVDETVVYGIGVGDLRKGPGVFPSNPMPGTPGNAAIAGHRTTYGAPFHDLDLIQPGDEILLETLRGEFTYVVEGYENDDGAEVGYFIVPESGVHVLDDYGDNRITLIACHPKYSSRNRIIVTGILEEEPVAPPPTSVPDTDADDDGDSDPLPAEEPEPLADDDWGEGINGDSDALIPTIAWGALFGLALLAVGIIGHWWRRWPVYLLSTPALAWLLWSSFVHLDQLLPSY